MAKAYGPTVHSAPDKINKLRNEPYAPPPLALVNMDPDKNAICSHN
jgi:hypothetical protein